MFVVYALKPLVMLIPSPGPGVPYPNAGELQCQFEAKAMTDEFESKDMATLAKASLLTPEGYQCLQVLDPTVLHEGRVVLPQTMVSQVGA